MRRLLYALTCLFIFGCGTDRYAIKEYQSNLPQNITIGSSLMSWGYGYKGRFLSKGNVDGTRMELTFGGIDHRILQLTYREYSLGEHGEFTRSTYSQELKYDLSKSTTITFRDIQIAIDSASQEKLVYRILREPNGMTSATNLDVAGMKLDNGCYVSAVEPASKAELAGIHVGDKLISVNNRLLENRPMPEIVSMFKGDPESFVELLIDRNGTKMNIMVKRNK